MLAAAGVGLALIPGVPQIALEPETALALFIAPALVDAAFDFPAGAARSLWQPLFALAVFAVVLSAVAVAGLGVALAGLPLYAALALGAIVAPPDAAAATAVLGGVNMPTRVVAVLKGESLLNDASALLIFAAATSVHHHGGGDAAFALRVAIAVPGGVLLGILFALFFRRFVVPFVAGTLGGNLLEFVGTFGVWIIAERLELSAVLCLVAFAMTIARGAGLTTRARSRIHSFAVWDTAVFLLNVLAFLLMGLQARSIVGGMSPERLREAALFALAVILVPRARAHGLGAGLRPARQPLPRARRRRAAADQARGGADRLVRHARPGDARDRLRAAGGFPAARPDRAHRLRRGDRDARGPGPDPRAAGAPARARW